MQSTLARCHHQVVSRNQRFRERVSVAFTNLPVYIDVGDGGGMWIGFNGTGVLFSPGSAVVVALCNVNVENNTASKCLHRACSSSPWLVEFEGSWRIVLQGLI